MTGTILPSLRPGYRALVFGTSGGIGGALADLLAADPACGALFAASRAGHEAPAGATALAFALEDEASIAAAVAQASAAGPLDLVLVATGWLHDAAFSPEKSWAALDPLALERAFRINATGPALIAKHALPRLPRTGKAVFAALSARVGSITDNRLGGWHAYRAAKAALNMLIRTFAIELARRNPQALCLALHPGTVATALSQPFQSGLRPGQLQSPMASAAALLEVIDRLDAAMSGRLVGWDGAEIPF